MNSIQIERCRHTGMRLAMVLTLWTAIVFAPALAAAETEPTTKTVAADAVAWWSVDSGGGRSGGGTWAVVSAIGQTDAGTLTGGASTLEGGFVVPDVAGETPLFADGFETGSHGAWSSVTP